MSFNNKEYSKSFISGESTKQVFDGKGILHAVLVGSTTGTAFVAYDGTTVGSTVTFLKASIAENTYPLDVTIATGLYITCGTGGSYTVLYSKA